MITFEKWLKETNPEFIQEGWVKNLAIGGALVGAGLGHKMSQPNKNLDKNIKSSAVTSDDEVEFTNPKHGHVMSKYSYNHTDKDEDGNEIGKFTPIEDKDGSWIYRTKKGDYKRVKSSLGNFKFVKIN